MSAAVGVLKRTNGTLTDVWTIPPVSGVTAIVDCWATAKVAAIVSSNNNPVFFMLPPTTNCFGTARAVFPGTLSEHKGYRQKVASARGGVKVTRVFSPLVPKCFLASRLALILHLDVASGPAPL